MKKLDSFPDHLLGLLSFLKSTFSPKVITILNFNTIVLSKFLYKWDTIYILLSLISSTLYLCKSFGLLCILNNICSFDLLYSVLLFKYTTIYATLLLDSSGFFPILFCFRTIMNIAAVNIMQNCLHKRTTGS